MQQYFEELVQTLTPMIPEMFSDNVNLTNEDYDYYQERSYNLLTSMPVTDVTTVPVIDAGMLAFAGEEDYEKLMASMISVAIIAAQNNKDVFNSKLIRTRDNYELFELSYDITEQIEQVISESYMMKTDVIDGLKTILDHTLASGIKQAPDQLLIISDGPSDHIIELGLEFLHDVRDEYDSNGITMPRIIFWYFSPEPVGIRVEDNGVVYVDGFSLDHAERVLNGRFD